MNLLIITQKVDANDQLLGFFIGWLERLAKKFDHILIFCLEKGEFNLPENVEVVSLGKDRHLPKVAWLFNFYKYIFRYRKQYDVVLVHMNPIWFVLGGIFWRLSGKKIYLWYTHKAVTFKLWLAEKLAHTIFTASKESFRLLSKKIIVTRHGVDTDLFKPAVGRQLSDTSLKILSVGRIAPVKNYEVLVDAAKILSDNNFHFSIMIIGEPALKEDKAYYENLKSKIKNLKLDGRFNFVGRINHKDLPSYYQSHNIFVHLSKTGSIDKTLLEAMASGMQVLSSNESSRSFLPPQLVISETNPADLASKIVKIKESNINYNLREYVVKNHNLDNLIEKISTVIQKC